MPTHYLTVQDVIWLNTQITGAPQTFHFARLEDGVYFQYGYGASTDVPAQAKRLAKGLAAKQPFAAGNRSTALAATLAFLALNGYNPEDAPKWLESGEGALHHDDHHLPTTAQATAHVIEAHREWLTSILEAESSSPLALQPAP